MCGYVVKIPFGFDPSSCRTIGSSALTIMRTSFGPSQVKPGGRWWSLCLWMIARGRKEYASDTITNCPPRLTPGLHIIPVTKPDPYSPYPMNPQVDSSPHKISSLRHHIGIVHDHIVDLVEFVCRIIPFLASLGRFIVVVELYDPLDFPETSECHRLRDVKVKSRRSLIPPAMDSTITLTFDSIAN